MQKPSIEDRLGGAKGLLPPARKNELLNSFDQGKGMILEKIHHANGIEKKHWAGEGWMGGRGGQGETDLG